MKTLASQTRANDESQKQRVFEWLLSYLMLFGAIIAAITAYLLLFKPGAPLLSKMPKTSLPDAMDYVFMFALILVGILNPIFVLIMKKSGLITFIIGLAIYALAYLYQVIFKSAFEKSMNEYILPYSVGPVIIVILLFSVIRHNRAGK